MASQQDSGDSLGAMLSNSGCRMVPDGQRIKVVTFDGTVVLEGDFYDIRDRVVFNCYYYGDPIIHPSVNTLYGSSAIFRSAAALRIEKSMGNELGVMLALDPDSMGWDVYGSGSSEYLPEEEVELDGGDVSLYGLPRNRVGALRYYFESQDIQPTYHFVRFSSPPYQEMYMCIVSAGNGSARGRGFTVFAAKQAAAGEMLLKIQDGIGPDNTKTTNVHGAFDIITLYREPNLGKVTQEHLDAWGAVDVRRMVARFKAVSEGSIRESGDPRTMTPRKYGIVKKI